MALGNPFIVISSGGTGGHMSPASALASDLLGRGYKVEMVTDQRGQKFTAMFEGVRMHVVPASTIAGGLMGKLRGVFGVTLGLARAIVLLRRLRPDLVVGFGGYPSLPGVYAAQILGIPTIIHEQNAIIGRANVFLARKAERIALSLPEVRGLDKEERLRAVITGNPVREAIARLYAVPYPDYGPDRSFWILVMGGSLGAAVFSRIVPEALATLPLEYRRRLRVVQQCRAGDIDDVRSTYKKAGIEAVLAPFFEDVADQLAKAHLVIGRSGASTVAEVTVSGRPAIFVPYPHHKDQQQKMNADAVADGGGAWVMTEDGFTQDALRTQIETFFQNSEILPRAAEKSRAFGRPDAAKKLGNLVTAVING